MLFLCRVLIYDKVGLKYHYMLLYHMYLHFIRCLNLVSIASHPLNVYLGSTIGHENPKVRTCNL